MLYEVITSIAGEDINMRSGPGTDQPILWKLGSGFPLEVDEMAVPEGDESNAS